MIPPTCLQSHALRRLSAIFDLPRRADAVAGTVFEGTPSLLRHERRDDDDVGPKRARLARARSHKGVGACMT
jgi:hypothetical protein